MGDVVDLIKNSNVLNGNCPGVYFLFDDNELVYIGKGWNCFLRVAEHTRKESDKKFTSWNYIKIDNKSDYDLMERELIKKYNPKYNKHLKK